jgi:para-aminobenzoate synthetase component 1
VGGLYTDFVVVEHTPSGPSDERGAPDRAWLVLGDGALDGRASVAARRTSVERALADAPEVGDPRLAASRARGPLRRLVPPEEHLRRVRAVQAHIGRGECYQANLAHRYERAVEGHPIALYLRLREVAPAPYRGLVRWPAGASASHATSWPEGALLSSSPELLLEVEVEPSGARRARTRPIKGTAPRSDDPALDRANAEALLASAKDRAELAMIVDLERNDLGRCARAGGVSVEAFPRLESYAAVHHLTADVVARIEPGRDAIDVLEAIFPGGSITGAPKLAAMEAIARLEGAGRGFFTGSLGFVDARGRAAWNILIRTLVWRPTEAGGEVSFHAGGGVTWSSDPAAEERETLDKARALIAALEPAQAAGGRAREELP